MKCGAGFGPGGTAGGMNGLRVAMLCEGSRGDCQPYIALALKLKEMGCTLRFFTCINHEALVKGQGIDFFHVFPDSEDMLVNEPSMQESMKTGDVFKFIDAIGVVDKKNFPDTWKRGSAALDAFKPQIILHGILSGSLAGTWGRLNKVPVLKAYLGVYLVTGEVAPLGLPSMPFKFLNRILWKQVANAMLKTSLEKQEIIISQNGRREEVLAALPQNTDEFIEEMNEPILPCIIGVSDLVYGVPSDVISPQIVATGWWILDSARQIKQFKAGDANFGGSQHTELTNFLTGPPPIYLGWGSMLAVSAEFMTTLAVSALRQTNRRGIVLKGWGGIGIDLLKDPELIAYAKQNVLFVKSAPHEWLFPQCALTVTHGGSGTTACALRSGKPAIITPIFLDQHDFANSLNKLNVGVGTCQFQKVTTDILSKAIEKCLTDVDIAKNAAVLQQKLIAEDGCTVAADIVRTFVEGPMADGSWYAEVMERQEKNLAKRRSSGWPFLCCKPENDSTFTKEIVEPATFRDGVPQR